MNSGRKALDGINREQAWYVLNGLGKIGPVTIRRLLDAFGDDPLLVLAADPMDLRKVKGVGFEGAEAVSQWYRHFDLSAEMEKLDRHGARFVSLDSPDYPPRLRTLFDRPTGLFVSGHGTVTNRAVAIVGTRRPSLYGLEVARQLGLRLASAGWCVVSGMARGIDTAAHEGALEAGGITAAVMGCGLDIVYPPENRDLRERIREAGLLVSEFRFGTRASKITFPMRNRLVSGMCKAVVVVETGERGGSLITARFAVDQGRDVYAVPGRIDQEMAKGCHLLIREGATLMAGVDSLLEDLNDAVGDQVEFSFDRFGVPSQGDPAPSLPHLEGDEATVFRCLTDAGKALSLDSISESTGLDVASVMAAAVMLELGSLVRKRADGAYESGFGS